MIQMPHHVWKTMDRKELRQFALAVFFLFAAIGPLTLLMEREIIPGSWLRLLLTTLVCGGFSWSIVMAFNRPVRLAASIITYIVVIMTISLAKPDLLGPDVPSVEVTAGDPVRFSQAQLEDIVLKRSLFGVTAVLCITAGYALFVRAIGQASRRRATAEADMALAKTIHESLLPKEALQLPWCEAAGKSVAAAQIGGDFFDLVRISDDRILALVADASGHGTGAGILSAMTKSGILQELQHTQDVPELLRRVNHTIHSVTKKNMFVTGAAALFDRASMTATLVTAGHPPVLRYRPADGGVELLRTQNLALGIAPATTFTAVTVPLHPGDLFCFITDGMSETNNHAGEQFGMERLTARLCSVSGSLVAEACGGLIGAVTDFAGTQALQDDVTALLFRVR